jgi:hypothetical protein
MQNLITFWKCSGLPRERLLTLLTAFLSVSLLACQSPVWSPTATSSPIQRTALSEQPAEKGFFVQAVIRGIDARTGVIDLDTEAGSFYVVASRVDLAKLHEGDKIIVYLLTDDAPVVRL